MEGYGTQLVKSYVSAGLPNITGDFVTISLTTHGAFYYESGEVYTLGDGNNAGFIYVGLDASRSSSIYGSSNTVQPNAYTVYYIIKFK